VADADRKSSSSVKWVTVRDTVIGAMSALTSTEDGSMHDNTILVRRWTRDTDAAQVSLSLECVCLFSLLGIVLSAMALLSASDETIAAVTAALAMM